MLENAPTFAEISEPLIEFLDDTIFVAHNASFDYSFIKAEFNALGIDWKPKRLCTVRLARKAFPGLRSYSLGNLCNSLDIINSSHHRALGDARAATDVLKLSLTKLSDAEVQKMISKVANETFLPAHIDRSRYDELPEKPGVYYFLDEKGKPIYIGKAKNLKKRVRSHFAGNLEGARLQAFIREIHHIDFKETGSELVALLMEDAEIRKFWPKHNNAQKKRPNKFGVFRYEDQKGYVRLIMNKVSGTNSPVKVFPTSEAARQWMVKLAENHELDFRLIGMEALHDHADLPPADIHNGRMNEALEGDKKMKASIIFHSSGRTKDEKSFVWVEKGELKGFGFAPFDASISHIEALEQYTELIQPTEVNAAIIRNFLEHPQDMKVIRFNEESTVE